MKIREENCNMFLLAAVTVFTVIVAGSVSLVSPTETTPTRLAAQTEHATTEPIMSVDQSAVRVVGSPFVPNTNPRLR